MPRKQLALAVVAASALFAPAASAASPDPELIRIGRGLAGISLGMTQAEVKDVLGEPVKTKTATNEFGSYTEMRFKGKLRVTFQGDETVTAMTTTSEEQRTRQGIHVGSSENRLRQKINGVNCETFDGRRSCTRGRLLPGRRVTTFYINSERRIKRITIGFVID
jgi:hypothetical protein